MPAIKPELASRKYVDLIFYASSKYGNWDPSKHIQVGDYGVINRRTGQFEKEGNVFDDPEISGYIKVPIGPPDPGPPQETWIICSRSVKNSERPGGLELGIPEVAEASIKGKWQFGSKRGALLLMDRPRLCSLPDNVLLKYLIDVPALKEKVVVTETVDCPAYSLYLSNGNKELISIALIGKTSDPMNPTNQTGGTLSLKWWSENTTGNFHKAHNINGSYLYTTLFQCKTIRKKGLLLRDKPLGEAGDNDFWHDAYVPWDPLSEDGEEIPFEDVDFES